MKIIFKLILAVLIAFPITINAQGIAKGQKDLNIGLGAGNSFIHYHDYYHHSNSPGIGVSLDYAVLDELSIGGYIGYTRSVLETSGLENCSNGNQNFSSYIDTYTWTFLIIALRADYHFGYLMHTPENFDLYSGLLFGDDIASYKFKSNIPCRANPNIQSSLYGGPVFSFHIGARYRFNDHFGAFTELGWGISYLTIGLNYKF